MSSRDKKEKEKVSEGERWRERERERERERKLLTIKSDYVLVVHHGHGICFSQNLRLKRHQRKEI